jgi:hypothetical protein
MNAVIEHQSQSMPMTAKDIRAHVNLIQEVMGAVMQKDTHYGVIPGTNKPTLYKAGSEVLLSTFRIAVELEVEDLSGSDEIRYRVRARGRHQTSGIVIGEGIGECSSNEEKYRWRSAVCDAEFEQTPDNQRRMKFYRNGGTANQVRTSPADVANTVLKMAKKRAQIDMTLTALAASDIFTQDVEDVPEEMRETVGDEPRNRKAGTKAPRSKGGNGFATEAQQKLLSVKIEQAGMPEKDFLDHFEITALAELPFNKVNDALAWLAEPTDG